MFFLFNLTSTHHRERDKRRWAPIHEFVQVALERHQLEVRDAQCVGAAVVEQDGVVEDNDGHDVCQGVEVLLRPYDMDGVRVACGLVHEENIDLLEHDACQGELHATPIPRAWTQCKRLPVRDGLS